MRRKDVFSSEGELNKASPTLRDIETTKYRGADVASL